MVVGTSKLARFPVKLPITPLPDHVDIQAVVSNFSDILSKLDDPESYLPDAVWRDHWALTGTLRTFYSAQGITKAWTAASKTSATPVSGSLKIFAPAARRMDLPNGSSWLSISGSFDIKTKAGLIGKCTVIFSVVPQGTDWKIWSFGTILDEVEGWPSVHQFSPSITNGEQQGANHDYVDVVVVGAGQTGLSMAGRLSALGVDYLLIDKYSKIGDSWGARYDSVKLHTPREYSHLPFERTFPDTFPEYLSKDQLAQGFNDWSWKYGVDKHTWLESELVSGKWDDLASSWKLYIRRKGENASIGCRFVIMAVGSGGQHPYMPDLPGRESFKGVEMHSADYKNCQSFGANARGVVVGTGNTAHDVAEDMADAGLPSTMVQRSRTYIMPAEHWKSFAGHMYNEHVPTDMADTIGSSQAQAVGRLLITTSLHAMAAAEHEAERFDGLTRAGYDVARFGDLLWVLTERAGGYYMDVGACQKIIDGKVSFGIWGTD